MRLRRRRVNRDPELELRREALGMINWDELHADPDAYLVKMREEAMTELDESERSVRRAMIWSRVLNTFGVAVNVGLGFWNGLPWGLVSFGVAAFLVALWTWSEAHHRRHEREWEPRRARLLDSYDSSIEKAGNLEAEIARIEKALADLEEDL